MDSRAFRVQGQGTALRGPTTTYPWPPLTLSHTLPPPPYPPGSAHEGTRPNQTAAPAVPHPCSQGRAVSNARREEEREGRGGEERGGRKRGRREGRGGEPTAL